MTKKILLRYSMEKANQPILASIIRETGASINILRANLSTEGGEIFIGIDEPDKKAEEVINLFKKNGVKVEEIKRAIRLDEEACIECGACISLCPTDALKLGEDYSIVFSEDECVYCEACIPPCPTSALSLRKALR